MRMWDVDSGQRVEAFQVDEMENVGSVHFTPDGSRLLSQEGSRLRVHDARTGQVLRTFAGSFAGWDEGAGRPRSIALSPGGKYVLAIVEPHPPHRTADRERPVVLLDVDSGDLLRYIPRMGGIDTAAVGFSPCGKYVLTVDQFERMARLWKVE